MDDRKCDGQYQSVLNLEINQQSVHDFLPTVGGEEVSVLAAPIPTNTRAEESLCPSHMGRSNTHSQLHVPQCLPGLNAASFYPKEHTI